MSLVRLVYASTMSESFGPEDVLKILEVSRKNNPSQGITGALCYDTRSFLQCLEGSDKAVNALYCTLVRDDRHADIRLLDYRDIRERRFGEWTMAYARADDVTERLVLRFSEKAAFDAYALDGRQAIDFLAAVCEERRRFLEEEHKRVAT